MMGSLTNVPIFLDGKDDLICPDNVSAGIMQDRSAILVQMREGDRKIVVGLTKEGALSLMSALHTLIEDL